MTSSNFGFIEAHWREVSLLGARAESYVLLDARSAIFNLRLLCENLVKDIYQTLRLPAPPPRSGQIEYLQQAAFGAVVPKVVMSKLHAIRKFGNRAAHGDDVSRTEAMWLLKEAHDVCRWATVNFHRVDADKIPAFVSPKQSSSDPDEKKLTSREKQALKKLADQDARISELLTEIEKSRDKVERAEKRTDELASLREQAERSADILKFDEASTRSRIIDNLIAASGWLVGSGETSTQEVQKEYEVDGQPTETGRGFVDYVLFDSDGSPLAVVEAKKASVNPERGREQAKLYADALEAHFGQRPVIYYTNGYDIWMWDDASRYPPRKVFGYYSKDSLQYLVKFQRSNRQDLNSLSPIGSIVNRVYQLEAIKRVSERFTDCHRKALIVQATGTGKTRVAIALAELLIRAGWVKRVLFLCDRKELRKQAKNAFVDHLSSEPVRIVNSKVSGKATERIFIATYPAMMRVHQSFDVGFFDLIIADESHRSVYNVYGDLFRYFDSLQVGLTATPVNFVTRSTFGVFGCEGKLPTFNYDLEEAVSSTPPYLAPFEVVEHTTQFLREGIKLDGLSKEQVEELEEQGEDANEYDFSNEQIDKAIFNRDTNRLIIRNLMENGIRQADGQTIGKSIIFARNHQHAMLISDLFNDMYPQYAGGFCRVIDTYDPRAESLIDDFKEKDNPLTIAISVDMLDTGIDVPEIVNLAFAKPIKSPVKFWQMVGRGTRLCEDLFGPGKDKSVFRIFDHWGNFQRFEEGYTPTEPKQSKSLYQTLFEQRVLLAETALTKSEPAIFDWVIEQVSADINSLDESTVAVREHWKEKRSTASIENLKRFDPGTVAVLRETIAPLMQWRDIRGKGDAHAFDLLVARMQVSVLHQSSELDDLKIEFLDRVGSLEMHLNPVREKADVIKEVKTDTFWNDITVDDLERVRIPLREIIHHRIPTTGTGATAPKIIDVTEDTALIETSRRSASLKTVDMAAYKQLIEAELKDHFDTNPVLKKIRAGEAVDQDDLRAIISLVLTQNPDVKKEALEEFFNSTTIPLEITLRSMVGLDEGAVRDRFSSFVLNHSELTAKQTRFLALLQNHITKFGFITVDRLYDQPFTVVDADGPEGIFDRPGDIDELIKIVKQFSPDGIDDSATDASNESMN